MTQVNSSMHFAKLNTPEKNPEYYQYPRSFLKVTTVHRLLLFIVINIKFTAIINFSFKNHTLNTCYILSTVLDTGGTEMNKTQSLSLRKVKSSGAKRYTQQTW